jgi:AraC family transcriptional regulator
LQNPQIRKDIQFKLIGCIFYGNPFHQAIEWTYDNEIGHLWARFMNLSEKHSVLLQKLSSEPFNGYELHLEPEEYQKTHKYYVMVGLRVSEFEEVPLEFFSKSLPKSDFLEFTTQMEEKDNIGSYIYKKWMPENRITQRYPFILQRYDSRRYRGLEDPTSEIDWLIPIQIDRKGEGKK